MTNSRVLPTFLLLVAVALMCGITQSANALVQVNEDFSVDPGWIGVNNTVSPNTFGYSLTSNAGGAANEAGGFIARGNNDDTGPHVSYADDTGTLDPTTEMLSFSGKMVLDGNGNVLIGYWASSPQANLQWEPNGAFLGFRSDDDDLYSFAGEGGGNIETNLGSPFTFDATWDPTDPGGGSGTLSVSINGGTAVDQVVGLGNVPSSVNRFGAMNLWIPGSDNVAESYIDDLNYTVVPEPASFVLLAMSGCLAVVSRKRR